MRYQFALLASTCTFSVPPAEIVGLEMFMLYIYGIRLVRLFVQFRLPVASYSNPISFGVGVSDELLFAGPAAIVKFNNGFAVPLFTETWSAIWGSWFSTLPPALLLLFTAHGLFTPALKVMLLLNVQNEVLAAALRSTKILLVSSRFLQSLEKQTVGDTAAVYHKL